ncbi:MAG: M48 family metallopeptidase [Synergistaceae bacterium]|jgi:heat shock protein HtpX|nr:M48 family metallopeptidase [Synergistaceae bacterium]
MNIYDHIDANRRRIFFILLLFPAALYALTWMCCAALEYLGGNSFMWMNFAWRQANLVFPFVVGAAALWVAVAWFGAASGTLLGIAQARRLADDENPETRRLVENVALMAGLPTPAIYLIDDSSLNAFATGRNPKHSALALTTGIVEKLEKRELEGVIAHEMAHIGNRDTAVMGIVLVGIGVFALVGEVLLRSSLRPRVEYGRDRDRGRGRDRMVLLLIGAACLLFGYVIAPLIRMALSRRMEFQADATAAKITRRPDALADALEHISQDPVIEVIEGRPFVGNVYIENPAAEAKRSRGSGMSLWSTHPPIADRIAALRRMARGLDAGESQNLL